MRFDNRSLPHPTSPYKGEGKAERNPTWRQTAAWKRESGRGDDG